MKFKITVNTYKTTTSVYVIDANSAQEAEEIYYETDSPPVSQEEYYGDSDVSIEEIKNEAGDASGESKDNEPPQYTNLYPKYNCPTCGDWFHMPYKYCKCDKKEAGDGK